MAKLALTLTLFIALFILTGAEHPLDLPNDDWVSVHDPSITLPEPDSKRTILLPSEKPESESATMVELEQTENEKTVDDTAEMVEEEEEKPEMKMQFRDLRPVWSRDLDQRMMFLFRHPHHRCHHPHRRPHPRPHHQILFRQFDVERPELEQTERSYENDMLVADPEMDKRFEGSLDNDMLVADPEMDKGFEGSLDNDMLVADPETEKRFDDRALEQDLTEIHVGDGGGRRHAPSRWVGLHFGGWPRFLEHEHGPHPHHHHHRHHHDRDEDEEHRHEHRQDEGGRRDEDEHRHHKDDEKRPFGVGRREENGGGLVKRFRKFLHNIDF